MPYVASLLAFLTSCKVDGTRAGKGNRTLIRRLEISYTNRCAIPAYYFSSLYKVIDKITKNENSIDTIKSTNKKFTKDIIIIFSLK